VTGLVVLSSAENGSLEAIFDAGAITRLRTGAAAVLAAETLGRPDAETAAVIGAGINGKASARTFAARGRRPLLWDVDEQRGLAGSRRARSGCRESRDHALAADLVVTVTPGHETLLEEGSLRPGQHASLMGADGPREKPRSRSQSWRECACSATTGRRQATTAISSMPSRPASASATT
jgi:ornithine cyclodeaminase